MPDIHVDSSSSYYPSKEDVNQKINLWFYVFDRVYYKIRIYRILLELHKLK